MFTHSIPLKVPHLGVPLKRHGNEGDEDNGTLAIKDCCLFLVYPIFESCFREFSGKCLNPIGNTQGILGYGKVRFTPFPHDTGEGVP
jgi:hypothetical protein